MSQVTNIKAGHAVSWSPPRQAAQVAARVDAIDQLRGLVMVLMALDHVRAFFSDAVFDPLDLTRTTPALFLTRWVAHFCAPVFVFLAGTGAFLAGSRGKTRPQLAWFLLTRGLWLVLLEFTLVQFGWFFHFEYTLLIAQVIWAIGWSMVALAALVFLPTWVITILGVLLIASHNALGNPNPQELTIPAWLWTVLVRPGSIVLTESPSRVLLVAYPILPWLGIMLAGYGFGALWLLPRAQRRWWLLGLGTFLLALFGALRAANGYGDPRPWSLQASDLFTALSFLNCTKYPPSLLFVLMTLGPSMLLLAGWDRERTRASGVLVTFGRVPLFYYLLHVPLIHVVAMAFAYASHGETGFLPLVVVFRNQMPSDYGYGLPVVYGVWIGVVLLLYPPCRWFAAVKRRYRWAWLSYL
jgi:uncharacterized membrane protein